VKREDWDRRYAEVESLWSARPNRFLVAEATDLQPGRALDLACGEGQNSIWLAQRGWQVVGVDFSEVAVAKGRRRAAEAGIAVDFQVADLLVFEPDSQAYDLVITLYLHLLPDERRLVLERAAGAVAPGGTFLLIGHHIANLTDGVGGPSDTRLLHTPEEIGAELPGLEVEKAERVLREVHDADRPAIDALVRATRPRQ
jgi:SAM-dependent methyltransferase